MNWRPFNDVVRAAAACVLIAAAAVTALHGQYLTAAALAVIGVPYAALLVFNAIAIRILKRRERRKSSPRAEPD